MEIAIAQNVTKALEKLMNKYALKAYIYQTIFLDGIIAGENITPRLVQQRMLLDKQMASAEDIREELDGMYMRDEIDIVYTNVTTAVYKAQG